WYVLCLFIYCCRVVFVFFLVCGAVQRALHCFPTRRSSDLETAPRGDRPGAPSALRRGPVGCRCGARSRSFGPPSLTRPAQALRLDRKSTRLNSSHVKISYAVFCLKKKNNYSHHGN